MSSSTPPMGATPPVSEKCLDHCHCSHGRGCTQARRVPQPWWSSARPRRRRVFCPSAPASSAPWRCLASHILHTRVPLPLTDTQTHITHIGPPSPVAQIWRTAGHAWHFPGQTRHFPGQCRSELGQFWTNILEESVPNVTEIRQVPSILGRCYSIPGQCVPAQSCPIPGQRDRC